MMKRKKMVFISICLVLLSCLAGVHTVALAQETEDPSADSDAYLMMDGKILWLSQDEEMNEMTEEEYNEEYRLSPERESKIVHEVPSCPVIIDGIKYEPEQIHLFDGQRLRFTVDSENNLYAFTTEEAIDKLHQEQRELLAREAPGDVFLMSAGYSYFYENMYYGGSALAVPPGYPGGYVPNLGIMNDKISSFTLDSGIYKACLYEDLYYGGDVFERVGGTMITSLWIFGWNDRASSLKVYD
jgi:hypothetical protein